MLKLLTISLSSLLLLGSPVVGQSDLWPNYAVSQYAGSIGLLSGGAGYQLARNKLEIGGLLGYLPSSVGGTELWTAAAKLNYIPWQLPLGENIRLRPFATGIMAAHTFGSRFWGTQPGRYPKSYYSFSTAWHLYLQAGSSVTFPLAQRRLGIYYELNASAEELITWIQNPDFIGPGRIFNLALGAQYYF